MNGILNMNHCNLKMILVHLYLFNMGCFILSLQNVLPDHLHTNGLENTRTILFNTSKKVCNFLSLKSSRSPLSSSSSSSISSSSFSSSSFSSSSSYSFLQCILILFTLLSFSPPPSPPPPFYSSPPPPPPSLMLSLIPYPPSVEGVYSIQWVLIVTESAQDPLEHTAVS